MAHAVLLSLKADMDPSLLRHAVRDLPRYTSYPTAAAFGPISDPASVLGWARSADPGNGVSVYVHTPFCEQLCWYCGCHTTIPNGHERVAAFVGRLLREIDLWAEAGAPGPAQALHFGGGSPNAMTGAEFAAVVGRIRDRFGMTPDAEIAVELDPRSLRPDFVDAMAECGAARASLGVQTFDARVQALINRIQPVETIEAAVAALRSAGVRSLNFDLMYGLPGQDEASVARTARLAAALGPDRLAVFGYAHVPWFKKHQQMIRETDLAGVEGRWAQAEAAERVLLEAGYVAVGLDHYARPDDPLAVAARERRLRRNFQGYTTDLAETLIPLGPSAIGAFREGFAQNARSTGAWSAAIDGGRLAIERGLATTAEDRLRAAAIERLMCDGVVDASALCRAAGFSRSALDGAVEAARLLEPDGLCRVDAGRVEVGPGASRLVRAVAACFDAHLGSASPQAPRHAKAV